MRTLSQLLALCVTAALAACSVKSATFMLGDGQNCQASSDCSDPACTGASSCQPACGNGIVDPGDEPDGDLVGGAASLPSPEARTPRPRGSGVVPARPVRTPGGSGTLGRRWRHSGPRETPTLGPYREQICGDPGPSLMIVIAVELRLMAKNRTPRTITIDDFHRDRVRVLAAARKAVGVWIVNGDGSPRFHISIPHAALPESRR